MEAFEALLTDILTKLQTILDDIKDTKKADTKTDIDHKVFFDKIRDTLFNGKLTAGQVNGMEAKLKAFREEGFPLSWAAYTLATSYHETAKRMLPVKEGLSLSDDWRKKNLRYYPYYGRGDVQLTWKTNYERADKELGLNGALLANLDLALDPVVSAKVIVIGMKEGWFSKGHSLPVHLPDEVGTIAQFKESRRIVNIMDKAVTIAGYAIKFQDALSEAGYGKVDN